MKKTKKYICVLTLVMTFFVSTISSLAASNSSSGVDFETGIINVDQIETLSGIVGILTIFSSSDGVDSSATYTGHAFVTFTNTSSLSKQVGVFNVYSGQEVTIGTRGGNCGHVGVWYNSEAYKLHYLGSYSDRVSLSMYITQAELNTLNSLIASGDTWTITNNCSSFASRVWNSISSIQLSAGIINNPGTLKNSIKAVSGYQTCRGIQNSTPVGYASGNQFVTGNTSLLMILETE